MPQVLSPSLLANAVGCAIMGLLVGSGPFVLPRFPALYAGVTAGFCGSATSFSAWSVEVASIFARGQARDIRRDIRRDVRSTSIFARGQASSKISSRAPSLRPLGVSASKFCSWQVARGFFSIAVGVGLSVSSLRCGVAVAIAATRKFAPKCETVPPEPHPFFHT